MLARILARPTGPLILGMMFTVALILGYVFLAGTTHFLLRCVFRRHFEKRYLNRHQPSRSDVRREIFNSFRTMVLYGLLITLLLVGQKAGMFHLYFSVRERGVPYFLFSIVVLVVLNDTYYYWMHRLMHQPFLYKTVHATHHKSLNPTPWASFSFSPWETCLLGLYIPAIAYFFPMHALAGCLAFYVQMFHNVLGHAAHELMPPGLVKVSLSNTVAHHQAHHEWFNCNYGLHFQWWDKLMGTSVPGTQARGLGVPSDERWRADRSLPLAG
jgi:sterol desaturase/sphingolipid hydroxylase (fatty acid hydroxylase superfamily)